MERSPQNADPQNEALGFAHYQYSTLALTLTITITALLQYPPVLDQAVKKSSMLVAVESVTTITCTTPSPTTRSIIFCNRVNMMVIVWRHERRRNTHECAPSQVSVAL
jgi:hypothetical protein